MTDVGATARAILGFVNRWVRRAGTLVRGAALAAAALGVAVWLAQDRAWPRGTGTGSGRVLGGVLLGVVLLAPAVFLAFVARRCFAAARVDEAGLRTDLERVRKLAAGAYAELETGVRTPATGGRGRAGKAARLLWRAYRGVDDIREGGFQHAAALVRPFRPSTFAALVTGVVGGALLLLIGLPVAILL
jgi:hypothetical protein